MATRGRFRLFSPAAVLMGAGGLAALWLALRLFGAPLGRAAGVIGAPLHSASTRLTLLFSRGGSEPSQSAYDALLAENAGLRALADENAALKEALAYRESSAESLIAARVVADQAAESSRTLIIDKGERDGIEIGRPVIVAGGIIVGKIARVGATTAAVTLLSDAKSRLAVSIQGTDTTIGLLEGARGLSMNVSLIPPHVAIAPGDTVVTSGLEDGVRRGLIVGIVEKVTKDPGEPFQEAHVVAPASARYPLYVQVAAPPAVDSAP